MDTNHFDTLPFDVKEIILNQKHALEMAELRSSHLIAVNAWEEELRDFKDQLNEADLKMSIKDNEMDQLTERLIDKLGQLRVLKNQLRIAKELKPKLPTEKALGAKIRSDDAKDAVMYAVRAWVGDNNEWASYSDGKDLSVIAVAFAQRMFDTDETDISTLNSNIINLVCLIHNVEVKVFHSMIEDVMASGEIEKSLDAYRIE